MAHGHYTAQFKTDVVLEVIQGENGLEEIALHYGLNPNMVRNWKREFLAKASIVCECQRKFEPHAHEFLSHQCSRKNEPHAHEEMNRRTGNSAISYGTPMATGCKEYQDEDVLL